MTPHPEPGRRNSARPQALALIDDALSSGGLRAGLDAAAALVDAVIERLATTGPYTAGALDEILGPHQNGRDLRRALDACRHRLQLSSGTFRLLTDVLPDAPLPRVTAPHPAT